MHSRSSSLTSLAILLTALAAALIPGFTAHAQAPAGMIVFSSGRGGNEDLYLMSADGSNETRLTDNPAADFAPAFSSDGTKIAFLSTRSGEKVRDIFVRNADGTGVMQITHTPEPGPEDRERPGPFGPESPAFHPQGDRIVFSENFVLYVVKLAGGAEPQPLHAPRANGISVREFPVYSPDGARIAFAAWTETEDEPGSGIFSINSDIFVMNADGTGLRRLTTSPAWDSDPAFSPDGTRIVFAKTETQAPGLYVISSNGGGETRLTTAPGGNDVAPVFSPDGSRIAFSAFGANGRFDIFAINANGGGLTQLTDDPADDIDASWAPGDVAATLSVTIANGRIDEGNSDATDAVFTVALSSRAAQPVSVNVATANGSATAGEDYTAVAETIVFAPGELERTVRVPVLGDAKWEVSETFFLQLSAAQNATISTPRATALIVNDDAVPIVPGRIVFVSYRGDKGDIVVMDSDGSASFNLTDTPDVNEFAPVWSPDGSRIAFVASEPGTFFPDIFVMNADGSGRTNLTNTPRLSEYSPGWSPDGTEFVFESNEEDGEFTGADFQLYVMRADGSGREQITRHLSTFGIFPGKTPIWAATGRIFFADHRDGSAQIASLNPDGKDLRVLWSVPSDTSDTLRTPAVSPDGSKVVFVQAFPTETVEQYDLILVNENGSDLVKLTDDDATDFDPIFSPDGKRVIFSSFRNGSVDLYSVPVPETAPAARAQAVATPQRVTSGEGDERDPDWDRSDGSLPPGLGVSVSDRVIGEGGKSVKFVVRLSTPATRTVTLRFATEDGTAAAGSDYVAQQAMVSFAPGQQKRSIRVRITNDTLDEEHETFSLKLSDLAGEPVAQGKATILDDDRPPRVTVDDVRVTEPGTGSAEAVFVVRLSAASGRQVSLEFRTREGTASEPEDYSDVRGSVLFAPGETEKIVTVPVHADATKEGAETFLLELDTFVNARGKEVRASATIRD